ncbi:MAG TPA: hypothetical protein VGA56_20520 [Opitutaceae bacterium]
MTVTPTFGQPGDEDLGDDRPETWAMQFFTSLALPTGFGPAEKLHPWKALVALDVVQIPWLSEEERRVGFNGTKVEDLNHAPVVARPNLTIGLPGDWTVSFAYVPPVRAFDLRTDLYGMSVQKSFLRDGPWQAGLRAFAQYARVRGTFTCTREAVEAGDDPVGNPFGCEACSNDTVRMRVARLEVALAYRLERFHRLTPFATASWQNMDIDFEVDALRSGSRDHRYLKAETQSWIFSAGARLPIGTRWTFAAAVLHAPIDVLRPGQGKPRDEGVTTLSTQLSCFF